MPVTPISLATVIRGRACERNVRDRLFRFYDWCARHDDIPELLALARTITRWEDQITAAVITGVTNAKSESRNRIARLEARNAYSFRNAASQRRRVRTACNRAAHQQSTHRNHPEGTDSNRTASQSRLFSKGR